MEKEECPFLMRRDSLLEMLARIASTLSMLTGCPLTERIVSPKVKEKSSRRKKEEFSERCEQKFFFH